MLDMEADPRGMTVAATFSTKGGAAAALTMHTLLVDGEPAVRLLSVEGEVNGKEGTEITLVTHSMPRRMRKWVKSFITGHYKKHAVALVTNTGVDKHGKSVYSRFDYNGVVIKEVQFPALGKEDGKFMIHLLYQKVSEKKNVKPVNMLDVPVRSQFFKFSLGGGKNDTEGAKLGKSVFALAPFSIVRPTGMSKQDGTTLRVSFPAVDHSSPKKKDGILPVWKQWATKDKKKSRQGKLTLYYWTGQSMEIGHGAAARGQLKVLFELKLNDVSLSRLETADGKATLSTSTIDMSDH